MFNVKGLGGRAKATEREERRKHRHIGEQQRQGGLWGWQNEGSQGGNDCQEGGVGHCQSYGAQGEAGAGAGG